MTFQDTSFTDYIHGIQETFKTLFMMLMSVNLSPYVLFSPIIVNFLILVGFPSQKKLKIIKFISLFSCSEITSIDAL